MADFPTFEKNANKPTEAITIAAPADNPTESAEERWLDQQWRDAEASGIGAYNPLSINRDSANVTNDPYKQN